MYAPDPHHQVRYAPGESVQNGHPRWCGRVGLSATATPPAPPAPPLATSASLGARKAKRTKGKPALHPSRAWHRSWGSVVTRSRVSYRCAMRALIILLIALEAAACAIPTPAKVFRFERTDAGQSKFRACTIHLNISANQLFATCGRPLGLHPYAVGKNKCVVYASLAHSLGTNDHVAPYYAVCLSPGLSPRWDRPGNPAANVSGYTVVSVYGLSDYPKEAQ